MDMGFHQSCETSTLISEVKTIESASSLPPARNRLGTEETFIICNAKERLRNSDSNTDFTQENEESLGTGAVVEDESDDDTKKKERANNDSGACGTVETRSNTNSIVENRNASSSPSRSKKEETITIVNQNNDCNDDADDETIVSSLSKDDSLKNTTTTTAAALRKCLNPIVESLEGKGNGNCNITSTKTMTTPSRPHPPLEVSFKTKKKNQERKAEVASSKPTILLQKYSNSNNSFQKISPRDQLALKQVIATQDLSLNRRPSAISRMKSVPVTKQEESTCYTGHQYQHRLKRSSSSSSVASYAPNHHRHLSRSSSSSSVSNTFSSPTTYDHPYADLLGNRKQRKHPQKRYSTTLHGPEICVGEIVGQSRVTNVGTGVDSANDDISTIRRAVEATDKLVQFDEETSDGSACCRVSAQQQHYKKNFVQKEIQYITNKVSRALKPKVKLQRTTKGCLV